MTEKLKAKPNSYNVHVLTKHLTSKKFNENQTLKKLSFSSFSGGCDKKQEFLGIDLFVFCETLVPLCMTNVDVWN